MDVPPVIAPVQDALAALCRRFAVRRLDVFGSATDGRFNPQRSDLNFLVWFDESAQGRRAKTYFGLHEALTNLFGREVDLLAEPALENPFLRRRIEAQRRQLYPPA